ncbi:UNVERIFIED_CONTAM: hypothetical protein Slati_3444700 [Sesamum latifolium]|uniref:Uncharacterized protein n=1 Tax=Sesamum latifolium TaxID=2727402 RepID=A0AAW2UG35_9LAMI
MKRLEEAERKNDPKYCKYHRLVGYAIQDCFVFKDKDSCNAAHGDDTTSNEDILLEKEDSSDADDCMSRITFTDEDLLLGSKPPNRPLSIVGYVHEQKVNIILINGDTIKLALANFGTPSGTALPFISLLHQRRKAFKWILKVKATKPVNSKLAITESSCSGTKSVSVTTRSMSRKVKESSQMTPLTKYVQKDLGSPNHASEDDGNKSPPSSPRSVSSFSLTTNVAPVMVINAATIEEQLENLTRAIEGLTKHVQEQDAQIGRLIHKADNVDASHFMGKQVEAHDEADVSTKQYYAENDKSAKELQVSSDGLIHVDQLREFIEGTIRIKIKGSSKLSLTYSKPYTPRIDSLKMPMGYQPPKF